MLPAQNVNARELHHWLVRAAEQQDYGRIWLQVFIRAATAPPFVLHWSSENHCVNLL